MFSLCCQFLNAFKTDNPHYKDFLFKGVFWESEGTLVAKVYAIVHNIYQVF